MEKRLLIIADGPRLTSCSFAVRQTKEKRNKKVLIDMELTSTVKINPKGKEVIIGWAVKSDSKGAPFNFDIEVEALFKVAKKVSKKEIVEAISVEAGPLLVVALRDIISDLTRRAEMDPFYISYPDFATLKGKEVSNK